MTPRETINKLFDLLDQHEITDKGIVSISVDSWSHVEAHLEPGEFFRVTNSLHLQHETIHSDDDTHFRALYEGSAIFAGIRFTSMIRGKRPVAAEVA